MSLKRIVGRALVKARRAKRKKAEKEIRKLQLDRNKSLRKVREALTTAQAKENLRDAKVKEAKALGIKASSSEQSTANRLLKGIAKSADYLLGDVKEKPKKKKASVKKTTKSRS